MRISRLIGLIVAASVLAACSANNSAGLIGHPATQGNSQINQRLAHAMVAPGLAGRLAILRGYIRPNPSRGAHHDTVATRPCTYLDDNFSGDVRLYNKDLTLAVDFGSTAYGWGIYATNSTIFMGRNDGSGALDTYMPCTDTYVTTIPGLGTGGAPFSIAGFKAPGKPGYAVNWPNGDIEYWATGSGSPVSKVDPNTPLPYFIDRDTHGNVWITGWDPTFTNEILDKCDKTITTCTTMETILGGFPGGVQIDKNNVVYVNDQFGTLYSWDCSGPCTLTGTFVYSNGSNPLDYTAIALDCLNRNTIWGANIYLCNDNCSFGIAGDAQPQSIPLSSATLGTATAGWDNTEPLGIARYRPNKP